ncbi:TPA: hypothetical protein ACQ744_004487, partial [Escherichia coli]
PITICFLPYLQRDNYNNKKTTCLLGGEIIWNTLLLSLRQIGSRYLRLSEAWKTSSCQSRSLMAILRWMIFYQNGGEE